MPKSVDPGRTSSVPQIEVTRNAYQYPMNLDLRPNSTLHNDIVSRIYAMAEDSQAIMRRRWSSFEDIEKTLTAYALMDEDEYREKQEDPRRPVSVVVPISSATLETLLTVWMGTLANGEIFKYTGVGPEDRVGAMLLQLIINAQCRRAKTVLNLHTQWRDALAYGLGFTAAYWKTEYGKKAVRQPYEQTSEITGQPIEQGEEIKFERGITFEGNALKNVSVFNALPDPNVAAQDIQEAEFFGFTDVTNYTALLSLEQQQPKTYFNVKYLKGKTDQSPIEYHTPINEDDRKGDRSVRGAQAVDRLVMYANIIPKDWKLGKSEYPEKWVFEIGGNGVLIRCQPINLNHGKFPVSVCCPSYDGYAVSPVSRLEMISGMQSWIDWKYRSNMANITRAMKIMFIADPYLVNYDSMVNSKAGGIALMREAVWGRGVQNALAQIPVHNVTAEHMATIGMDIDLIQRVSGAVNSLQGIVQSGGERRSATEMRDSRMSALGRVQKDIQLASLQSMADLGYMFASHEQQFMTRQGYYDIIGENAQELQSIYTGQKQAMIDPLSIAIDYDVIVGDGSTPGGEYLPDLMQLYQMTRQVPDTANAFDPVRQILDLYIRAGVKGAANFLRMAPGTSGPEVLPNDQAMEKINMAKTAMPISAADLATMMSEQAGATQNVGQ
jgi:hypothetical protein